MTDSSTRAASLTCRKFWERRNDSWTCPHPPPRSEELKDCWQKRWNYRQSCYSRKGASFSYYKPTGLNALWSVCNPANYAFYVDIVAYLVAFHSLHYPCKLLLCVCVQASIHLYFRPDACYSTGPPSASTSSWNHPTRCRTRSCAPSTPPSLACCASSMEVNQ